MKQRLIASIVIAAGLMGCDETIYKLELTPKGNQLNRTLTVWREGTSGEDRKIVVKEIDEAELAAVARAYSKDKPEDRARKHKFTGSFANIMPNDIGGAGRFMRYESKMGVAAGYVERFRGNDRPGEVIEASMKAVNVVTDILIGYLESELGKEAAFSKLRKFMDTEFRKDLKNISVYSYMAAVAPSLHVQELTKDQKNVASFAGLMRVLAYLVERKYIDSSEVPALKRTFVSGQDEGRKILDEFRKRMIAKAGIADAKFITRLKSLLADQEKLFASFEAYLRTTPMFKKRLKELKDAGAKWPAPDPENRSATNVVFNDQVEKIVHWPIRTLSGRRVEVQLTLPAEPIIANGKWDANQRTVTWKGLLSNRDKETIFLPQVYFAFWGKPDGKFQKARFGKVVLTGDQLLDYCIWRHGLKADEAKLWDAVLMKHKPGQDLEAAVEAASDPDKPMPYIIEGLRILKSAMME